MEQNAEFLKRFAEAVKIVGGNRPASLVMNVSEKSVERYKVNGGAGFNEIRALCSAANKSLDWLAYGAVQAISEPSNPREIKGLTSNPRERLVTVPVMNVAASAGGGAVVPQEEKVGFVGFDAAYLRSLNLTPSDLFTLPSGGESMEPTILSGEFLLCSMSHHHTQPADGIYVIRLDGDVLVKRLQRLPGKKLRVTSDNKAYQAFEIDLSDGTDFKILGKVILVHGLRRV